MSTKRTGFVCFTRPARKRVRIFTAKDCGRIVANARKDGASDILLIAYLLKAFGLRELQCLLFKVLDAFNIPFFLGGILLLLKGISTFVKVVKIFALGKKSRITISILEILWPSSLVKELGVFLLWVGSIELALGAATIFVTAMSNNIALYMLMKGICEAETEDLRVDLQAKPDTGSLYDDIMDSYTVIRSIIEDQI